MQTPSGKFIRQGNYQFYLPDPLPPLIDWDLSLINTLKVDTNVYGFLLLTYFKHS